MQEEAAKQQKAEKETTEQEEKAAEVSLTSRERRELAREATLLAACKAISRKGGMSEKEAGVEAAKIPKMSVEERTALVDSTVNTNVVSGFKYFKPQCLDDCRKNWRTRTAPPSVYPDGTSDDEEWCRDDPCGDSISEYYVQAMDKMRCAETALVSRMMKSKLMWAAGRWTPETPCPFEICMDTDKSRPSPKTWITKVRYLRHLTEWHFNHFPRYDCVAVKGRMNALCPKGDTFFRRGDVVRHLMDCHKTGMRISVPRLNALHNEMWEKYQSGCKEYCDQEMDSEGGGFGKMRGFFKWNKDPDRLHIADGPEYEEFSKFYHKNRKGVKRSAKTTTQQAKKARASGEREGVLERVAPHGSGVTFSSTRTDWSAGPSGVHVSSIAQRYPEKPEEAFDESFPDPALTMQSGPETQVLTKNLKDKRVSGQGPTGVQKGAPGGIPPAKEKPSGTKPPVVQQAAPIPEGYLPIQRKELPAFAPSNKASWSIQQGMVNTWQDGFNRIVMAMHQEVSDLSLGAISQIHDAEKDVLKTAADAAALETVTAAQKAADAKMAEAITKQTKAEGSQGYLEKRLSEARAVCDNQNWQFENVFGHDFKDWDGTRETIDRWLREKDAEEVKEG